MYSKCRTKTIDKIFEDKMTIYVMHANKMTEAKCL
jgi:hypothetical protein